MNKKLSIIIVTYNSESDIYDCLDSVKRYSDIPMEELEIIIVDNNSACREQMFTKLREMWGDNIILVANDRNGGYGQGNNVGFEYSTASVSLIMNPDVRLMQPIFDNALKQFSSNEKLGILGMKQMLSPTIGSPNSFSCDWLTNGYLRTFLCTLCTRLEWYIPSCMYVQGSCFFIRNKMFEEVGLFDDTNFMYGEEEDIHYRMKAIYGNGCFEYDAKLRYIHQTLSRQPSFEYEKKKIDANVRLYLKKHISEKTILKHFLQSTKLYIWYLRLRAQKGALYEVHLQVLDYLKNELNQS